MAGLGYLLPSRFPDPDEANQTRLRVRSVQISATFVTIFATAWLCTLGLLWALISLMVAKHILVAILLMHVGLDRPMDEAEVELLPGGKHFEKGLN